jgi:hypothetical protein
VLISTGDYRHFKGSHKKIVEKDEIFLDLLHLAVQKIFLIPQVA